MGINAIASALATPELYLLWLAMFAGTGPGLMVLSNVAQIAIARAGAGAMGMAFADGLHCEDFDIPPGVYIGKCVLAAGLTQLLLKGLLGRIRDFLPSTGRCAVQLRGLDGGRHLCHLEAVLQ